MALCDKDRIDALMKLVDFRMQRIVSRRDHEWKVTIGLWALFGAGIAEFRTPHVPALAAVLIVIVIVHAILWVRSHWVRSKEDMNFTFFYADNAQVYLGGDLKGTRPIPLDFDGYRMSRCEKYFGFLCSGRCWAQILTTALFALVLWYVNWRN